MATQGRKQISSLLLGLVGMHILLPVVLSLAIMAIKGFQHRAISSQNKESALFARFPLSDIAGTISADKEFCRNGIMYDLKCVQIEDGKYVVYALRDDKETRLAKTSGDTRDSFSGKVVPFVFLFHQSFPEFSLRIFSFTDTHIDRYARHPRIASISVNSPPPWNV